ncbi:hypothetical protein McanMca71_004760 [Microsporum canis]|uniref:AAA+ ATPase domain-containing protein n=1 Tax=Arthroderma otae (strain ATCC MYA-4605 / CBS 113480) TaxID=554155 RepID=C5FZS0_ARTOC|nr:conserved hypothetical protein [Microsporum canis CBS 113480]EEQ35373.1 conserved hypothetical protein [Microsporum canis CBS 113480]
MAQTENLTGQTVDAPPSPPSSPSQEQYRKCTIEDEPITMNKSLSSAKPTSAGQILPEHPHSSPAITPSGYPAQNLPKHPHSSPSSTPPPNYSTPCVPSFVTREELKDILMEVLRAKESSGTAQTTPGPTTEPDMQADEDKLDKETKLMSKLEYKTVNDIWNKEQRAYELTEGLEISTDSCDKYEEYLFVVRHRHGRITGEIKTYLDFKSSGLVGILQRVMDNVLAVNLREDKPSVPADILFHFVPEFEDQYKALGDESIVGKRLGILVDFLKKHFSPLEDRLNPLLDHQEITFELLGALFKPNELIFMIDQCSGQPRCFVYDSGELIKHSQGDYFEIECRSLDYDGKVFGEVTAMLRVPKFRSARRISDLGVFPLNYHGRKAEIEAELVERGRKFESLKGVSYNEYEGFAHLKTPKGPFKFHVTGRMMVDALAFKEKNPNYGLSEVKEEYSDRFFSFSDGKYEREKCQKKVKSRNLDSKNMTAREYILCSPTVLGFSLSKRDWAEFSVSNIRPIDWSKLSSFDHLEIPKEKKTMVKTMVESHRPGSEKSSFDDIVVGKGKGLIFLLYGPPGVGKTLTAESTADLLRRPLYSACAGDFGIKTEDLEGHLSRVLDLVRRWDAILLLDEADVFLSERSLQGLQHNALVSVFLRSLEYFEGIMFLTTNRHSTLDPAMQSRIHVSIRYESLSKDAKARVWKKQLSNAGAKISGTELERLLNKSSNGRQIKNIARAAFALAKGRTVTITHIETALKCAEEFDQDFHGAGAFDNMRAYT